MCYECTIQLLFFFFIRSFVRLLSHSLSILHNTTFSFFTASRFYLYYFFQYLFLLLSFIYHCFGRAVLFGCSLSLHAHVWIYLFPKKNYTHTHVCTLSYLKTKRSVLYVCRAVFSISFDYTIVLSLCLFVSHSLVVSPNRFRLSFASVFLFLLKYRHFT